MWPELRDCHLTLHQTHLFRLWSSSKVKSKMLAMWWLEVQLQDNSLCKKSGGNGNIKRKDSPLKAPRTIYFY